VNTQKKKEYPQGVYSIFLSEFISRFAFWGIQSLLVLYLVTAVKFSNVSAYALFGVYASMSWAVSILAGYVADKHLGFRRLLIFGFGFALLGNLLLLIHGNQTLYLGLSFLVFGTGLIIPSNSNMFGTLYEECDHRRDKGFGSFYVAGNLGALLGPILLGYASHFFGWYLAFTISALSFLLWIFVYIKNRKFFLKKGNFQGKKRIKPFLPYLSLDNIILFLFIGLTFLIYFLLQDPMALTYVLTFSSILGLLYLFIELTRYTARERVNIVLLLIMIFFVLIFFTCEFQTLNSFILFTKEYINLNLFGLTIPVTAFVSAESMFVVILTFLVVNPLWTKLKNKQPKPFTKLAIGTILAGISFLIFSLTAYRVSLIGGKVTIWWMILGIAIMALGELFIMPPLLSSITKMAPAKIRGTMIGIMYFAISISGYLSSLIAKLTSFVSRGKPAIVGFQITYFDLAIFMLGIGIVTLLLTTTLKFIKFSR
jgi:proton-dependent oligopeptide transporter, POT family